MKEPVRIGTTLDDAVDALRGASGYFLVVMDKRSGVTARTFVEAEDTLDFLTMSGALQHRVAVQALRRERDWEGGPP